jgi:5-methylthioribose kinase
LIPYFKLVPKNIPIALDHHNIESHMLFRRAENEKNPAKKLYFWQEGKRLEKYEKKYCSKCAVNITFADLDTPHCI